MKIPSPELNKVDVSDRYEQLYTMLLDAIPFSVLLIANNLRIISANHNFLEKSQRTLSSTIGYRLDEVLPLVILEQMDIARRVLHVIETNKPLEGERMTYRAPGIPIRIYYYSLLPFFWRGQIEGVILLMNDVTEQTKLGDEVRRVERHLASIVSSASDLMLSMDRMGNILTWNSAAERLSGYTTKEALGRNFLLFCADEDRADIEEIFAHIETRKSAQTKESSLKTNRSNSILISWIFSPLMDSSSRMMGIVAVGRNLTERREFEMELIKSQRLAAMGVLAGGIAHEIRNPLAICSSAAQFLMTDEDLTPEFRRECAEKIQRGIQRASSIIESLLKFSYPSEKNRKDPVDLVDMIKRTMDLLVQQNTIQKIETKLTVAVDRVMVRGEATLLMQVFMNLILNAIKAMPEGGLIEVDMRQDETKAYVSVSDTGCGIAEQNINKIFDPFYTTSSVGKGTGLGLSISYSIVQQHGGTISVKSIVGKGSTFTVTLPILRPLSNLDGMQ